MYPPRALDCTQTIKNLSWKFCSFWNKKEQKQLNFSAFCSNWRRYKNLTRYQNQRFWTGAREPCCFAIRIRTLNDGVRGSQSFFKTAYLSHFSDFASLKNLSEFYFCLEPQIRMRNCEHCIEEYMIMIGTANWLAVPIYINYHLFVLTKHLFLFRVLIFQTEIYEHYQQHP